MEEELAADSTNLNVCTPLFQSLLQKIIRHEQPQPAAISRSLEISLKFREMVQQHHLKEKTVLFYAGKLNISENYLNKYVKEATGKPPKQWINEVNMLHSQILLQNLSRDVAGIAFELNFQSASYFTRLFNRLPVFRRQYTA